MTEELVELTALDPSFVLDNKYARTDNFMGRVLYPEARALLQKPAAEALVRVQAALQARGMGLIVYDAYRPHSVTRQMTTTSTSGYPPTRSPARPPTGTHPPTHGKQSTHTQGSQLPVSAVAVGRARDRPVPPSRSSCPTF